ncbi:CENP-B protein, partial [Ascobolus immersus RN42]
RDLITVIETISAAGIVLPPMIIMPGIVHMRSWYEATGLEDDWLFATSDSGYTKDEYGLEWIKHMDNISTCDSVANFFRLLLLDNHTSHCTQEFIEYCDANKIIPFALPSHSTHLLQPLDVRVFQPYKHYHAKAIEEATRLGLVDFDKIEFLANLKTIRDHTFKESTIRSAFKHCGL